MAMTDQERAAYEEKVRNDEKLIQAHQLFKAGAIALGEGKLVEAAEKIDLGLKTDPINENALYNKAVILQITGNLTEAVDGYNIIIKRNPVSQAADYARVMVHNIGSNKSEIEVSNDKAGAVQLTSHNEGVASEQSPHSLTSDGLEALKNSNYDLAINKFISLTKIEPKNAGAWYYLGVAYSKLGDNQKAVDAYNTSLQINQLSTVANDARKSVEVLTDILLHEKQSVHNHGNKDGGEEQSNDIAVDDVGN